jgi:hypothetical protein
MMCKRDVLIFGNTPTAARIALKGGAFAPSGAIVPGHKSGTFLLR